MKSFKEIRKNCGCSKTPCETYGEAVSPAQQAAIAISKKERGEKPKNERKLTPAELKKREKIAKAIERDNPDMPMAKKMAIATATAKRVAEKRDASKSASGYDIYHKDFSMAMKHAYDFAKKKGLIVKDSEIDDKVASGPRKPSTGKTNNYILKTNNPKRNLHVQVYNTGRSYELNMYIQ